MEKKFSLLLIVFLLLIGVFFIVKTLTHKVNSTPLPIDLTSEFNTNWIKLTTRDNKDNYLISPYSIKAALNMLKEGADNNTLTEINNVLSNSNVGQIDNPNIKIANATFINNSVKKIIQSNFTDTIKNKYKGETIYDDFKSPKVINDWVNKNTNGMIPKILDTIDPNYVLGLANAIAIDVKWDYQFECDLTRKETFTKKDNTTMEVSMMHKSYQTSDVSYFDNDKATGIILPYEEETNLEYIAILPKGDIDTYLTTLTEQELQNIDQDKISANNKLHINLSMPSFKYDFTLQSFKANLIELGMKDAFSEEKADFSKIITKEDLIKNNRGNVYVDEAIHKTAIDLNESGTKAAAVTYFGLKSSTAIMPDDIKNVNIELNKTFIYMIREKTTKELLFFGVVNSPNKWEGSTCKEA